MKIGRSGAEAVLKKLKSAPTVAPPNRWSVGARNEAKRNEARPRGTMRSESDHKAGVQEQPRRPQGGACIGLLQTDDAG